MVITAIDSFVQRSLRKVVEVCSCIKEASFVPTATHTAHMIHTKVQSQSRSSARAALTDTRGARQAAAPAYQPRSQQILPRAFSDTRPFRD
ncbi:hypothetical protein MSG28_005307 [Choristoneura fumiferana]|uniref:Uncharacterized protein n=1 Tax=Choristoneura fumiferana TaxID=7141 RepID=A0ACC0JQN1_CHOFU|nr:hypothetical protein MSG28_005307 [Choristoneura fumiferana]